MRELLADIYREDVTKGARYAHGGWTSQDNLGEIPTDEVDRAIRGLELRGIVERKKTAQGEFVRLRPYVKDNREILQRASDIDNYRVNLATDERIADRVERSLESLRKALSASPQRLTTRILIPGFVDMLTEAPIRIDQRILADLELDYALFYAERKSILVWTSAYLASLILEKTVAQADAEDMVIEAKSFYQGIGSRDIAEQLILNPMHRKSGMSVLEAFRLQHLTDIKTGHLAMLAFCWLAYSHLSSHQVLPHTIEGEAYYFARSILSVAQSLISDAPSTWAELAEGVKGPLEDLWERVAENDDSTEIVRVGLLCDITRFPWDV